MIIRRLKQTDAVRLSTLHQQSLPETVSSKIGGNYLKDIYRSIAKNKTNNIAILSEEKNEINGVVCATFNLDKFQSDVKKEIKTSDYFKILASIISFNPPIWDVLNRIIFERKLSKIYEKEYLAITILFTNRKNRKKGIATKLLKKLFVLSKNKCKFAYVDTLSNNRPALNLYKSLGFKIKREIDNSTLLSRRI